MKRQNTKPGPGDGRHGRSVWLIEGSAGLRSLPSHRRYALTVLAVAGAAVLWLGLNHFFGTNLAFITFYPAVVLVAMLLGSRAGAVATVLSALIADYLFIPPAGSDARGPAGAVGLSLFVCAGLLISAMAGLLERSRRREAMALANVEAQEASRLHTAQFETLLNRAPLGVYLVDADFRIRQVNPVALPVFGGIPDLIGRDFDEVIRILWPREFADEIVRIFRHTLETGESYETPERAEYRIDRKVTECYEWRTDRIQLPDGRYGVVAYFRDISAQVQARARLAESEERLRLAIESAEVGTWDFEPVTGKVTWSDRCKRAFGLPPEAQVDYQVFLDRLHPEDRQRVGEVVQQALAPGGKGEYDTEYRSRWPDGTVRWIIAKGKAFFGTVDGRRRAVRFIGTVLDVTEHRQAEEALHAISTELQRTSDTAATGLTHCSRDLRYISANPAYAKLAGLPLGQIVGKSIVDVMGQAGLEAIRPYVERVLRGERVEYEAEVPFAISGARFLHVVYTPDCEGEGNVVGWVASVSDITARKQAEEALRESQEHYRCVVENTTAIVLRLDTCGVIRFANQRALEFFGYTADELIGRHAVGTIVPARETTGRDLTAMVDEIAVNPDRFHTNANENICKDGRRVWVEWTNSGIYDADGNLKEFLSVGIDATDRKRAEQQLKELNETLECRVAERTAEIERQLEQLRSLALQLTQAEQKERQRLANILHDHLQQLLVGTKYHLRMMRSQEEPAELQQSLGKVNELLDQSLDASRNLTVDLSPPILKVGNMAQVLRWLAEWMHDKHGLQVSLAADDQANPHSH